MGTGGGKKHATFEEYVRCHATRLARLAVLLTGDHHRGEDLLQEVLATAYVHWRRIRGIDNPDAYLRRMLVNANVSYWRRGASREVLTDEPPVAATGGDTAEAFVERDAMLAALAALPARQRAVLVLRYYENLDDGEISHILGCRRSTVRTHALRGIAALRGAFGVTLATCLDTGVDQP